MSNAGVAAVASRAFVIRRVGAQATDLGWFVLAAFLGCVAGTVLHVHELAGSPSYQELATVLLAVGLFGSTLGISVPDARRDMGTIVFATTVGVVVKAALITSMMYLFVDPRYAVLGLVVAQIDPLSVAAMLSRSRMSDRAKTILQAWSSFDDPVTVLMTVYCTSWLMLSDPAGDAGSGADLLDFATGIGINTAFAALGYTVWRLLRSCAIRGGGIPSHHAGGQGDRIPRSWRWIMVTALVVMLAWAVGSSLMLGVALIGLFFRPPGIDAALSRLTKMALVVATVTLGLLLADGVSVGKGVALASFAFLAQVVAAWILPARLPTADRIALALGQQNGITAIILALSLEPVLPGTIAIVAPAILVVNLMHLAANACNWGAESAN